MNEVLPAGSDSAGGGKVALPVVCPKGIMKRYTIGSSYSISTVFEAKLMESGKWRSAVDTENLPVNLPVELAQVRKKSTFFI
ncbi:MAG: hypothetical protein J6R86_07535 [Lentisphaeria bacterium]|nr:hypothetical protein [Lentisphaeria bacterium]